MTVNMSRKNVASLFVFGMIIMLLSFGGCREKNTNDGIETYRLWTGKLPTKDVNVINGKFWQSSHWSKEYIMYMELKASPLWRQEFIKQNHLVTTSDPASMPSDAPIWFTPTSKFRVLTQTGFNQGSLYFENKVTGYMFIYETQL